MRIFDALNGVDNVKSTIKYVRSSTAASPAAVC